MNRVPIRAPAAPADNTAATLWAFPMPPAASTGTDTALRTPLRSGSRLSRPRRWPPASVPWAMTKSQSGRVIGRREHEQVGQVKTGIAAGMLEVRCAEVVGHFSGSFLRYELEQGAVDLLGVRPRDGVRSAFDHDQFDVLDEAGEP